MNSFLKKFISYFVFFGIISVFLFFIIKYFDNQGSVINWIINNKGFLIFFIISIVVYFSLRGNDKIESKFIANSLIFLNFFYLCFLFFVGNIGLNTNQSLLLLGFIILGGFCLYLRNVFGYVIFGVCVVGSLIILYLSAIPLYDNGPDITGFEKQFDIKLFVYSDISLSENDAVIEKNDKKYFLLKGINVYDFKSKEKSSMVVFKSTELFENSFGFIVFPGGEYIQITPQSAININEDFEIDVLAGNIGYYPENPNHFSINNDFFDTGFNVFLSSGVDIVEDWYYDNLKNYIKRQLGGEFFGNKTMFKFSKYTLLFLYKIFPGKYEDNLKNLDMYLDILDINLENSGFFKANKNVNSNIGKKLFDSFGNGLKNGLGNTNGLKVNLGNNFD